jgi:hypothetical protein
MSLIGSKTAASRETWYHVYFFLDPADADKFKQRFDGEKFNPKRMLTLDNIISLSPTRPKYSIMDIMRKIEIALEGENRLGADFQQKISGSTAQWSEAHSMRQVAARSILNGVFDKCYQTERR